MRMPGRTVRVQWSREDEFAAAPLSTGMVIELRAMLDAEKKPADWTIEIWSAPHAQRPGYNGNHNLAGAAALPNAPALNEVNDVPDERGGGPAWGTNINLPLPPGATAPIGTTAPALLARTARPNSATSTRRFSNQRRSNSNSRLVTCWLKRYSVLHEWLQCLHELPLSAASS